MDNNLRKRQNNSQQRLCDGSPVSHTLLSAPFPRTNGTAIQKFAVQEETDVSKVTSPTASGSTSTASSPSADSSVASGTHNMPPASLSSPSATTPESASKLSPSSSATSSSEAKPSSFAKDSSVSTSAPSTSASPTSAPAVSTPASNAPESEPASVQPSNPISQPVTSVPAHVPGAVAAISPSKASDTIEVEAAPSTASAEAGAPSAPSASDDAAPAPTATADRDENPSPSVVESSPADAAAPAPSSSILSEILNPGATGSDSLSSALSSIITDSTTSSALSMATSISFTLTESDPASSTDTDELPAVSAPTGPSRGTPGGSGEPELQTETSSSSNPPTGMIIGGAVGGAAALAVIALLFWLWRRHAQNKRGPGQPRTPLSDRPGGQPSEMMRAPGAAALGPLAAGQQQTSEQPRGGLQGWWAARGIGAGPAPLITPQYGEKQSAVMPPVPARARNQSQGQNEFGLPPPQNPFSDANAAEAPSGITPQQQQRQQQRLQGILKQPTPSLHSSNPSESSIMAAMPGGRRSRSHSTSNARASQANGRSGPASRRTSSVAGIVFEDRRNKFRSDPFDLELDTKMFSTSSAGGVSGVGGNPEPVPARIDPRASSVYSSHTAPSSRYTSGMSSNWGDGSTVTGLTVAPLAVGGNSNRPGASDSPTLPSLNPRRNGPGSSAVVGQAF